jgi:hypothetical protein
MRSGRRTFLSCLLVGVIVASALASEIPAVRLRAVEAASGPSSDLGPGLVPPTSFDSLRRLRGAGPLMEISGWMGHAFAPSEAVREGQYSGESSTRWVKEDAPVVPETGGEAAPATETTVAINPRNPKQVIAGAIDFGYRESSAPHMRGDPATVIYVSRDGGMTWRDKKYVELSKGCSAADPAVAFDSRGWAYYSYIQYLCDKPQLKVMVSKNGGKTWARPTVVARPQRISGDRCVTFDKEYIGSGPTGKAVYLTWTALTFDNCRGGGELSSFPIYFSRSLDGGKTWSKPALVSVSQDDNAQGSVPRVGPDGTVYVAYVHRTELSGCPSTGWTGQLRRSSSVEIVVARSTDGGANWKHEVVSPVCDNLYQNPEQPLAWEHAFSLPSLSLDSDTGTVYVAWSNRDVPSATIKMSASANHGRTWSEPVSLQADPGQSPFMPWLVAGDRMVRLVYLAENSGSLYDVYYRESIDGGQTWTEPFRLSTQTSCVCYSSLRGPYVGVTMIGHYIGMDAAGGVVVAAWPDNRHREGFQTIYARRGTYSP